MHTIKVNIRDQRKCFEQLLDAMLKRKQVEGYYVIKYSELKELGERYATFTLCEAGYEAS